MPGKALLACITSKCRGHRRPTILRRQRPVQSSSSPVPVGTLVSEERWADWLGCPIHLFSLFAFSVPLRLCGKPSSMTFPEEDLTTEPQASRSPLHGVYFVLATYKSQRHREGKQRSVPQEGGTSSLRAPAHHWETSRTHGGPARRSDAAPTLQRVQTKHGDDAGRGRLV